MGFGIRTPEQAAEIARVADGVVVGSAIVARVADGVKGHLRRTALVRDVSEFCTTLAHAVHAAR